MDSFVFRNLDSEKPMKSHHHRRFPRITDVFRYIEICVVLFVLLWFSTNLPLNLTFFLQSFQDICGFLRSPRFVFVVGNAIVLTLFVKSGQFSADDSAENSSCGGGGDVYDEFVKNSVSSKKIRHETTKAATYINQETPIPNSGNLIVQETPVPDSTTPPPAAPTLDDQILSAVVKTNADGIKKSHKYQRSRSEYMKREKAPAAAARRELRRSKTEKTKEEMSNEEFQQTIEEFIARQVKFLREESMAVVVKK